MGRRLRWIRRAVAAVFLLGLAAAFADFRHIVPEHLGHVLASFQFVPSAVALFTGAAFSLLCILVLVGTLAFGRIYCGALCPLGLLQDAFRRLARVVPGSSGFLRHGRAHTAVRHAFLWATLLAIVTGWGAVALTVLDPYSNFGRFCSAILRPIAASLNNLVLQLIPSLATGGWYRVEVTWAPLGMVLVVGGVMTAIAVMSVLRGRLYCNTVCPVGTLLGLLSRRSAFRVAIDPQHCKRCAKCLRVCRAQCIDLRTSTVDASRCVTCFDCLAVCDDGAMSFSFAWRKRPDAAHQHGASAPSRNLPSGRRAFVTASITSALTAVGGLALFTRFRRELAEGRHQGRGPGRGDGAGGGGHCDASGSPLLPPGVGSSSDFLQRCTACQLCVSACSTRVLQPAFLQFGVAGLMKPHLDLATAFCNFDCNACGDVCPTGAIHRLALEEKQVTRIGVARFHRRRCIVEVNGTDCAACSEHCPTKAVHTVPFRDNLRLPQVDESLCIGCGACEFACPVQPHKAITVSPKDVHERAEKAREDKASLPVQGQDFPF